MNFRTKIVPLTELSAWRSALRSSGKRLAVTNGCFDLLHAGHVTYLETARNTADALLVGLNGDASVQALKGPGRPVNHETDRALVLAALESVTAVCVFTEKRAVNFLRLAEPDIYVKGGDYTPETLDPEEREILQRFKAEIVIIPFVAGKSTTGLLQRLRA